MLRYARRRRGAAPIGFFLVTLAFLAAGLSLGSARPDAVRPAAVASEDPALPDKPRAFEPAVAGDETRPEPEPMLVNKAEALPKEYAPGDLRPVEIPFSFSENSPKRMMRHEAADALERLFAEARRDGIELAGVSGYRSFDTQAAIFASATERYGSEEAANRVSARPGESEHQTGLAMDVSSPSVGYQLTEAFGGTKEGQWLAEHAPDFGFIIRYPEGKEDVTGYQYEPWHLRYVGEQHASRIAGEQVTLEEYLAV